MAQRFYYTGSYGFMSVCKHVGAECTRIHAPTVYPAMQIVKAASARFCRAYGFDPVLIPLSPPPPPRDIRSSTFISVTGGDTVGRLSVYVRYVIFPLDRCAIAWDKHAPLGIKRSLTPRSETADCRLRVSKTRIAPCRYDARSPSVYLQ